MRRSLAALVLPLLVTGCSPSAPPAETPTPVEIFSCSHLLIGVETVFCHEDVTGPGTLRVSFRPDPAETSWEVSVRGLAALAEQCEFHGQFDQTRLSALQGRGETDIVCRIAADVDRQYHELRVENRTDIPNTAINLRIIFTR